MTERNGATMTPPIPRLEDCPHRHLTSTGDLPTLLILCLDCGYEEIVTAESITPRAEPIVYGDDADTELLPTAWEDAP